MPGNVGVPPGPTAPSPRQSLVRGGPEPPLLLPCRAPGKSGPHEMARGSSSLLSCSSLSLCPLKIHRLRSSWPNPGPRPLAPSSDSFLKVTRAVPGPQTHPHSPAHQAGLKAAGFLPGMAQPQVWKPSGFQPEAFPPLNRRSSWGLHSPQWSLCLGPPSAACPGWDL